MAEWKDFGGEGIYQCSTCGMAAEWSHPRLAVQMLSEYCSSCGAKMENADTETPREKIKAVWMHRGKEHKYYCSICGQKESAPRIWCPNCGCRMSMNSWEKRWGIKEVTFEGMLADLIDSMKKNSLTRVQILNRIQKICDSMKIPNRKAEVEETVHISIEKDRVPKWLLEMPLAEMRCKHVLNINEKERHVLEISEKIGYKWCRWGSHQGKEGDISHHLAIINKMEQESYCHALRIVLCSYDFTDKKCVWIDNLHTAVLYMRIMGSSVKLKDVPFYVVDLSGNIASVIDYKEFLSENKDDVLGAVESAKKRKKRSDSEELISLNYTLEEFIDSNPELLMAER